MTLLGLDFDNTLVRYDNLFHKLALEKGLINDEVEKDKTIIRDHLREQGKNDEFTLLQGEVYGLHILDAEPAFGMLETLKDLNRQGIPMIIISHKTQKPYKGPAYDLRRAAIEWLEKHDFFKSEGLNWEKNQVIFEDTKDKKIKRIEMEGCSHYIDDLIEIISALPATVKGLHYCPNAKEEDVMKGKRILKNWKELDIEKLR